MKRNIELKKRNVEYTLKVSQRARKVRLTVQCDGNFIVTTPRNVNERLVEEFIARKAEWIIDKMDYFKSRPQKVFNKGSLKEYKEYKGKALILAQERIEHFNNIYNFKFNNISIKNQKTRWGSCSRKGNLNFNYKIALIPQEFSDYVIVHELCHLKELNHSKNFWNLVAKTIPNYLAIRKRLKRNEMEL